jgi:hypothetical protein
VDGLERVHRRLAKGDAGSTKLATLARALARGAAEAATEALALAVSADVAERMDAANLIAFAPLDTARALNERLTKDTDERVRDQTEMGWSMASERHPASDHHTAGFRNTRTARITLRVGK